MRLTLVLLAAIAIAIPMSAHAQEFSRDFDRFKGSTAYKYKIVLSDLTGTTPGIGFDLNTTTAGETGFKKTDTMNFDFMVSYDMSRAGSTACSIGGVATLIDGKPESLKTSFPPFFNGNWAITSYGKKLTYSQAQAFVNSKSVEFRICGNEYKLTPEQMAKIKEFLEFAATPST